MRPSDDFPRMPPAVKAWLDERAGYLGWPPSGVRWRGVLRDRPLPFWRALVWEQRVVHLEEAQLTSESEHILEDLAHALFGGADNAYSLLNTGDKLPPIGAYVREHRRLPGELILLDLDGRLDVVDGCHRLTTYRVMKSFPLPPDMLSGECDAWVGSTPVGSNNGFQADGARRA